MLSYPEIDRDRERLMAEFGHVRQASATSSVAQPTRRARWFAKIVLTPRHSSARTSSPGVH